MTQISKINGIPIPNTSVTGMTFSDTILTLQNSDLTSVTADLTGINIEAYFLKDSAGTINVGEVVYAKNWDITDNVVTVELADATTSAGIMPAIGICVTSGSSTVLGTIITNGSHEGFDTSAWSLNDSLYVSETAGELTNVRPTGATQVQTIGKVLKVDASTGVIGVYGAGRSNDIPNLTSQNFWIGGANGVGQETTIDDFADIGTPASGDYLMLWDTDTSLNKKVAWSGVSITTVNNIGGGVGIFAQKSGNENQLKSLTSTGASVTITSDGTTVNLENAAGGGETNTASNLTGTGLFAQKNGVDLEFKGITSTGASVTITSDGTTLNLENAAGGGETNTASNVGATNNVFVQKTGVDLEFRTITAGSNITISSGATELTINSTATGGGSSRLTGTTSTTGATPSEIDKINTLTAEATHVIEVFITAKSDDDVQWGVWKRTLVVTLFNGTCLIQHENSDVDKTSTGLNANSIDFTVNGTDIDIDVTGIAVTNIQWDSTYEIITKSNN